MDGWGKGPQAGIPCGPTFVAPHNLILEDGNLGTSNPRSPQAPPEMVFSEDFVQSKTVHNPCGNMWQPKMEAPFQNVRQPNLSVLWKVRSSG